MRHDSQRGGSVRETRGIVLLEVLLAMAVFSLVAIALTVALNRIGVLAAEARMEAYVAEQVRSYLEERSKAPGIQAGVTTAGPDEKGVTYTVRVEPLTLKNEAGATLPGMLRVSVEAAWTDGALEQVVAAETYRYSLLYGG